MIRGRLWRMGVAAWGFIARPFRRRSALTELQALDRRTLKDLGLHRGQLWFVADAWARGVAYHDPTSPYARQQHDQADSKGARETVLFPITRGPPSQGRLASIDGRSDMSSSQAARSGRRERQSTSLTRKSR